MKDDNTILERKPLEKLANLGELSSYIHKDFWFSMDTQRDQVYLNNLWKHKKSLW